MERKVQRAQGDKSHDELKNLNEEIIKGLKTDLEETETDYTQLCKSNKQLIDEIRTIER
jgi:hypothetical protein